MPGHKLVHDDRELVQTVQVSRGQRQYAVAIIVQPDAPREIDPPDMRNSALLATLTIDLLFGPIVFRLFNGLTPLDADGAAALATMALHAIVASHD